MKSDNKGFINDKAMRIEVFYDYKSECSVYKLNKKLVGPMLNDIVHIKAKRCNLWWLFGTSTTLCS